MLRPRELAESKFADDANKRPLSTLESARLVCVQEAVASNLDFPLLKVCFVLELDHLMQVRRSGETRELLSLSHVGLAPWQSIAVVACTA